MLQPSLLMVVGLAEGGNKPFCCGEVVAHLHGSVTVAAWLEDEEDLRPPML